MGYTLRTGDKAMKPDINSNEFKSAITVEQMRKSDAYTIKILYQEKNLCTVPQ